MSTTGYHDVIAAISYRAIIIPRHYPEHLRILDLTLHILIILIDGAMEHFVVELSLQADKERKLVVPKKAIHMLLL